MADLSELFGPESPKPPKKPKKIPVEGTNGAAEKPRPDADLDKMKTNNKKKHRIKNNIPPKDVDSPKQQQKPSLLPNLVKFVRIGKDNEEESNIQDFINGVYEEGQKEQIQFYAPEPDKEGNIEYKLRLVNPTEERFEQLATQMTWRLGEGHGVAYYLIGVEDNGKATGLSRQDMQDSLKTLLRLSHKIKADMIVQSIKPGIHGKIAWVMIRKGNIQGVKLEVRILLFGESSSGKSTLIGVLKGGQKDNGNGLARQQVFTHKNQLFSSGITMSVNHQVIGFDNNGRICNQDSKVSSWQNLINISSKIVAFIDVGGHKKAEKHVVSSLCSYFPEYAILVLSAKNPRPVTDQLSLAAVFDLPVVAVITHTDVATEDMIHECLHSIRTSLVKSQIQKSVIVVKSSDDVLLFSRTVAEQPVLPVFLLSNVTGHNLDLFTNFLNLLPPLSDLRNNSNLPTQFLISDKFATEGKIVLGGTVIKGNIKRGQILHLGPDQEGSFRSVEVQNVRCMRVEVAYAKCGQTCSVAIKPLHLCEEWLKKEPSAIRKGMVLVESKANPKAAHEFEAEITLFSKEEEVTITNKYQPVVNTLTTRQICTIVIMKSDIDLEEFGEINFERKKSKSINTREVQIKLKQKQSVDLTENKSVDKFHNFQKHDKNSLSSPRLETSKMVRSASNTVVTAKEVDSDDSEEPRTAGTPRELATNSRKVPKLLQKIQEEGTGTRKKKEKEEKISIRPGTAQKLRLRFKYYPEYITIGQKLIINDERVKAVGKVTQIYI